MGTWDAQLRKFGAPSYELMMMDFKPDILCVFLTNGFLGDSCERSCFSSDCGMPTGFLG